MNYNLLKIFVTVVNNGSFTKAAAVLNSPKSRISRAIATLETELEIELIRRTTRQISITPKGKEFFNQIRGVFEELDSHVKKIQHNNINPTGILRVTAPEDIGQIVVSNAIKQFQEAYPNIQIELIITNEFLNLTKENIDLAFRAGKLQDSSLRQRKLGDVNMVLVASSAYLDLYGRPKTVAGLSDHSYIDFKPIPIKKMAQVVKTLELKSRIQCDSFPVIKSLINNANGFGMLPHYYCQQEIAMGTFEQILPEIKLQKSNIHLVYPHSENQSLALKKFVEITLNN